LETGFVASGSFIDIVTEVLMLVESSLASMQDVRSADLSLV